MSSSNGTVATSCRDRNGRARDGRGAAVPKDADWRPGVLARDDDEPLEKADRRRRPPPFGGRGSGPGSRLHDPLGRVLRGWDDGDWLSPRAGLLQQILSLSGAESLSAPYAENQWVRACIKIIGNALLHAPPRLYRGDPLQDKAAKILPSDHKVLRLLGSPNEHQSGGTFRFADLAHMKLDGETIWFLMDRQGRPIASERSARATIPMPSVIVPVRGGSVEIQRPRGGGNAVYVYPSVDRTAFPAGSVVHFREYDPDNALDGSGDVESLLRDLATDFQAQRYQEGILANGGQPGGWIIPKRAMDPARAKGEEAKMRDSTRNLQNAGAWRIAWGEADIKPNPLGPKDLEYGKLRTWTFRAAARVLGVPLPLLGDMEHATFANVSQARRLLWTGGNGIISYLRSVEETINSFFLPRIKDPSLGPGIFLRHDLTVVADLQEDLGDMLAKAAEIASKGVGLSMADAASAMGLDVELPETARIVFVPAGMVPLGSEDEPGPDDGDDGDARDGGAPIVRALPEGPQSIRPNAPPLATRAVAPTPGITEAHEPRMARAMRGFFRRYEIAQRKRLADFAERGVDALKPKKGAPDRIVRALPEGPQWISSLTSQDIEDLLLNPQEWVDRMTDSVTPIVKSAFNAGAKSLAEQLGTSAITAENPAVLEGLKRQTFKMVNDVTGTLRRKTRRAMLRVFESSGEGVGLVEIQEGIKKLLPELEGSLKLVYRDRDARALAIARTEVGTAVSTAQYAQAAQDGAIGSRWITSGDEFVRDAHKDLDGEFRNIGDEFMPKLLHPHDVTAPPEQRIACRCSSGYVFSDDTREVDAIARGGADAIGKESDTKALR